MSNAMCLRTAMPLDLDTFRRRVAAVLAVLMAFAGGGIAAQVQQDGALFQPLEPSAAGPADDEGAPALRSTTRIPRRGGDTVRHREVRVDFARLAAVKADLESGKSATLDLNLFDDVAYRAADLRLAPTSSGGYSLAGRLHGVLFGTATLVVNGDIVQGSVRTHSGTYTIDAMDGVCHIRLVDPSSLPPLAEPLRPTASSLRYRGPAIARVPASAAEHEPVIDVLVAYTPAAREAAGGVLAVTATVELFVAETNQAYADSGVGSQVFLTRAVEVDYIESGDSGLDLSRLRNPEDGHMDIVHELRDKTGSDLVHLIADVNDVCGIAYLMTSVESWFQAYAFGLTDHSCGGSTFAHELGHNMGLRHDRYVDPGNSPYPYSHGYVNRVAFEDDAPVSSRWRTIMSYSNECTDAGLSCQLLLRFSNAGQEYEGDPLGIAEGDAAADAARSLNDTRRIMEGFRQAGPDLTATPLITNRVWDVGQTNIVLIGVVKNEGRIESDETTVKFYRSADPTIAADDVELASFAVEPLAAKESYTPTHLETAPDAGGYYYGVCVDAVADETDDANCSEGVYVTVGPTVSVTDSQTSEGETLTFPVRLSESRDTPVEVRWELARETAVAGLDYADVSGTVTIPADETVGSISVETLADDIPEADDTFTIALVGTMPAAPAGVVLSVDGTRATGTIVNDDGDPKFADSQLRAAVLQALGKPTDGEFTVEELAALRSLDARNTGGEPIHSLTGLEAATGLSDLVLFNNAVADLSPLGHLGDLKELWLDHNGFENLDGLAPLKGLTTLSLTGNPVLDIAPLRGLTALNRLWLDHTGVLELGPLAGLTALETLILECAPRDDFAGRADCEDESITDITPLAGLTELTTLDLNFNNVVDISVLNGLTRLNILDLWGNEIEDLDPLRGLRDLIWLDLDDNEVVDIRPLGGLAILRSLHLNGNRVRDLAPLKPLSNLETLGLNANGVTDIGYLGDLVGLRQLWLGENEISDIPPLAKLPRLELLDLGRNRIADISTLADLIRLGELHLQGNRIRDISPLGGLRRLHYLDLSNNDIRDIEPLAANSRLSNAAVVMIQGNPLTETSVTVHVPVLVQRGVDLTYIGVSILAGSAVEGDDIEFVVRVTPAADDDVAVNWSAAGGSASAGDDYHPVSHPDTVTVGAGDTEATFTVSTIGDAESEPHETIGISLTQAAGAFPDHVGLAGRIVDEGDAVRATALGLIVDPAGPAEDVPLFASAGDATRQGFLRVVNRGDRNVVHVVAADDGGNRRTTTLAMDAGETVHFNSDDLEHGNIGKGLSRGIGAGDADWHLELSGNDVDVLAYMRTDDGFLTSLHDVVPAGADGYIVPIFNPGKNTNQESLLRLVNGGDADAAVTVTGTDDTGSASDGAYRLALAAGEARTIPAAELEDGGLGAGTGKWRLLVASDQPLVVSSLMQTPTDHLTNLSTVPDNKVTAGDETTHHVHLFPSAADPDARQGFVRVVNRGAAGSVSIKAHDDSDHDYPAVALALGAGQTVHLNSADLEAGAASKGLPDGVGAGEGDWRLELTSTLDIDVLAYIRRTEDGFLTSMHDAVPRVDEVYRVPIFNPGSNRNQVSKLRLVNPGTVRAEVTITGVDDTGSASCPSAADAAGCVAGENDTGATGTVRLTLPAGKVRTVSARELEAGGNDLHGAPGDLRGVLGDGVGKWRLDVRSDQPIRVINLLESPTGHLTNLSTRP